MSVSDSNHETPSPDEIRGAVDRMVTSDVFARSPQLGAFVRFVVEAVLHGKSNRIKAYTIGVEVLRRDTKFDPQADPIVRVEATRLRRALERYYVGPGAGDTIIVELPRGSYVPTFRYRDAGIAAPAHASPFVRWADIVRARPMLASGVALALLAFVLGTGLAIRGAVAPGVPAVAISQQQAAGLLPGNGMPTILIERLRETGDTSGGLNADLLFDNINDAFARFDTINVAYGPRPVAAAADPGVTGSVEPRADYRLSGAAEHREGGTSVRFRLLDAAEGSVVWTRTFEFSAGEPVRTEEDIVVALTEALLQSYGVIRARDRAKHLASAAGDPRYRCILEAADSFRTSSRAEHDRARACLERLTALDPSFAVGYAFLAVIYGREHQLGFTPRPGESPVLDRALHMARRSIELNPASSRAYVMLMVTLFHRGEIAEAFAAGDKAIALNKYDMLNLAEYGGRLVLVGEVEKGMAMLRRAGEYGAIRPAWHHFYMFLGTYLGGDLKQATYHAGQITIANYVFGHVAHALVAAAAGDTGRARQALDRLIALQPGWRSDPRRELARLTPSPDIIERIARDLANAGLAAGS